MNGKLRVLDLFSGIGGFSLGLERAGGFETVAFCEIEPYCRRVLAKHWPGVPQYDDVRTLTADTLARDGITVEVICGGFPCQDLSFAGKRAGLTGARSGLWGEYRRLIGELRPRFVIVENVPGLLSLGMGTVLGDLAALGYDATWDCIPASAVGAPHSRDRVWIVGHTNVNRKPVGTVNDEAPRMPDDAPDANRNGTLDGHCWPSGADDQWGIEPDVGRVAHGVPSRVDRLKALGNSVVPQIPELIGRAIMQAEGLT